MSSMWEAIDVKGRSFQVNSTDISSWAGISSVEHNRYEAITLNIPEHVGEVRYILDFPEQGIITIGALVVEEKYRNQGVATALLARLHADYPDHKINPGAPPEEGIGFIRSIWAKEPVVRQTGVLRDKSLKNITQE